MGHSEELIHAIQSNSEKGVWLDAALLRKVFPSLQWSLSLTHGGEADSDGRGLANVLKDFGFAVASDVVCHLEVAKGTWGGGGGGDRRVVSLLYTAVNIP